MVPWRFRRSEMLDKKWKSLNHVITAQEFVLGVQQAREDRLKAVGTSTESVDTPGQTVATSGQTVGPSSETVCPSSQTVDISGQTVDTPGQTVATSGHTACPPGQTVGTGTPGQTVDTPGQTVGTSGQSVKTHMRISALELRDYLLKDVNKYDKEDETVSPADQNSGEDAVDPRLRTTTDLQSDPPSALGDSVMPTKSQYPVVGRGTRYSNRKRISKNAKSMSTEDGVVADTEDNAGKLFKHVDLGANDESQTPIGNLSDTSIENSESQKVSSNPKPSGHHILNNEMKESQKQLTSSHVFKMSQTPNRHSKFSALELHFLNSPLSLITVRPASELKKAKFARNAQNRTQDGGHRPVYAFGSHYIPKTCQYCGSYSCKGYQRRSKTVHHGSRTAHGDKDCGHQRSTRSNAFMSRVEDIKGIYEQRQAVSHAVHLRVAQRLQRVGVPQTSCTARGVTR